MKKENFSNNIYSLVHPTSLAKIIKIPIRGASSHLFLKFYLPVGLKYQIVLFVEIALVYRKSWQFVILHKRFQDGQLGPTWS